MNTKYKLNNWSVVSAANPYLAPELSRMCLMGEVEGHPERDDGKTIVTSSIVGKFRGKVITNNGSEIELGEPKEAYEKAFPNAKRRLFDTLPQCTERWDGSIR